MTFISVLFVKKGAANNLQAKLTGLAKISLGREFKQSLLSESGLVFRHFVFP